jgi:hypothetical protein
MAYPTHTVRGSMIHGKIVLVETLETKDLDGKITVRFVQVHQVDNNCTIAEAVAHVLMQ